MDENRQNKQNYIFSRFLASTPMTSSASTEKERRLFIIHMHTFVYGVNNNKAARKYIVKIETDDAVMGFTQ